MQPGAARFSQCVAKASFKYRQCGDAHISFRIIENVRVRLRRTRDGCRRASSMCVPSVGGVLADGGRRRCCSHLHLLLRKAEPSPPVQKRSRLQRPCSTGRPAAEFRLRHPPACTGEFLRMQQQQQQPAEQGEEDGLEQEWWHIRGLARLRPRINSRRCIHENSCLHSNTLVHRRILGESRIRDDSLMCSHRGRLMYTIMNVIFDSHWLSLLMTR